MSILSFISGIIGAESKLQGFALFQTDKAFNVKCFYAQARSATLERFVNVSNLAASDISVHDTTVAECRYEIRLDGPNGEMAQFAEVGQNLFHEWSCSGPDDLRILVKDCRVADDTGEQFLILDDRGCAIDPVILGDLEYEQNARKAHVYSNAFKFADTNHISFQCTVQLCSTIQGDQHCTSLSPPSCSVEGFDTNTMLKKYARNLFDAPMQDEVDLHSHTLAILDAKINADYRRLPTNKLDGLHSHFHSGIQLNLTCYKLRTNAQFCGCRGEGGWGGNIVGGADDEGSNSFQYFSLKKLRQLYKPRFFNWQYYIF
ncbi:unnamed protein product [Toxocara canis]|uniref:ZP domain-containing protein n=1 Tax=Toxocara canis TaxID=6265 RepID=A0A183UAQ7_TOXCA|nr:unnamed protein product [Toxocara canis]